MKNLKWSSVGIALCYIVAGILFFANAKLTREIICSWTGYILLIVGAVSIIAYFLRHKTVSFMKNEFRDGLILITLGTLVLVKKDEFISIVYMLLAIVIMISGYRKLQDCVDSWRLGQKYGILYLVLSFISIIIGLIVMLDAPNDIQTLHKLIGFGMLYSGVSDLISTLFISTKVSEYLHSIEEKINNPEN